MKRNILLKRQGEMPLNIISFRGGKADEAKYCDAKGIRAINFYSTIYPC